MKLYSYELFIESVKLGKQFVTQGKLSQDILDSIISIDPSKTKKYVGWLSKQYINNPYNVPDMKSYIEEYDVLANKNHIEKDINKFNNIEYFKNEVDKVNNTKTASNSELQNDYDVIIDNDEILIIRPNSHEASRKLGLSTFAFRYNEETGVKDSAWCTTYSNSNHWDDYYYYKNVTFYYCKLKKQDLIEKLNSKYKKKLNVFAVAVLKYGELDIYDANDKQIDEPNELTDELGISYLMKSHIDKEDRNINRRNSIIKLFRQEIIEGNLIIDFDIPNDIPFNTKVIKGNVKLTNVTIIPKFFENIEVKGDFNCSRNQLTSLVGAPKSVGGGFYCNHNQLTNLVGAPKSVYWNFYCNNNQLTSLEGAPKSVDWSFDCNNNQLTSLIGAPQSVGGHFDCSYNQLTNLVSAPKSVGGSFYCSRNKLTSLKGAPLSVRDGFECSFNQLTNLVGAPQSVGGYFDCSYNQLTNLVGAPKSVGGDFNCIVNPSLTDEHIEWLTDNCDIKGSKYK